MPYTVRSRKVKGGYKGTLKKRGSSKTIKTSKMYRSAKAARAAAHRIGGLRELASKGKLRAARRRHG